MILKFIQKNKHRETSRNMLKKKNEVGGLDHQIQHAVAQAADRQWSTAEMPGPDSKIIGTV